ncbi:MAG TPA: iron-sulfur cluster assembly accessory protein [Aquabacterium sp.]|uniref:HesB/IscA family protein n=1 Tax=Aquabacterium sp. TaxID=1872578 RepID=UPI002E34F8FC|nr:iron-sulfur cluster assembly accessory protein [Aquabacterium sp.]HEX5373864.1 iron-sulfur cluster assembly accessory protein [Aquabacterium sp.]
MLPTMKVTQAAERFMKRMVKFSGLPATAGFRLTVSPGGCSGYNSEFTVEASPLAGDEAMDLNGLTLFLPAESRLMLDGVTVDFADTPTQSGLTFFNPNAGACGCSSSEGSSASAPAVAKIEIGSIKSAMPRTVN